MDLFSVFVTESFMHTSVLQLVNEEKEVFEAGIKQYPISNPHVELCYKFAPHFFLPPLPQLPWARVPMSLEGSEFSLVSFIFIVNPYPLLWTPRASINFPWQSK